MLCRLFGKNNSCFRSVLTNGLDAIGAACLAGIALAGSDNLAVASLEAEAELASLVLINLKLGICYSCKILNSLVFKLCGNRAAANAVNTLFAGGNGSILLAYCNNFTVACLKCERISTLIAYFNLEFSCPDFLAPLYLVKKLYHYFDGKTTICSNFF